MLKRIIPALLALLLAVTIVPALGEEAEETPLPGALEANAPLKQDLDGDGTAEEISWTMVSDGSDDVLTLTVEWDDEAREPVTYKSDITNQPGVCVLDLNGDGVFEILLTGDVMSDDYYTICLNLKDGALAELLFPDASRGKNTEGWYRQGYGLLTAIEGGRLTLCGSQDMLGTWFATRGVSITPFCRFEFDDDGLWHRVGVDDLSDGALWEYAALTTKVELPYTDGEGKDGVLPPETKLIVTETDKDSFVHFTTQEGLTGTLVIAEDYDRGWGSLVDGLPEEECFEALPYAD